MKGKVHSINISKEKGTPKNSINFAYFKENLGILEDAHFGNGKKQVSLLPVESFEKIKGKILEIRPGVFAENITTKGLDFRDIKVGNYLKIGNEVVLRVSEIGKKCTKPCSIMKINGFCIMPKEGVFAEVIKGGKINVNDLIFKINEEEI